MRTFTFLVAAAVGSRQQRWSARRGRQTLGEVTVQATRNVSTKLVGSTSSGIPIKEVSLSYGVSTAGLDLATVAGAEELDKRINDAALAACKEVGRQYRSQRRTMPSAPRRQRKKLWSRPMSWFTQQTKHRSNRTPATL